MAWILRFLRRRYASIQSGSAAVRARIYIYSHLATPTVSSICLPLCLHLHHSPTFHCNDVIQNWLIIITVEKLDNIHPANVWILEVCKIHWKEILTELKTQDVIILDPGRNVRCPVWRAVCSHIYCLPGVWLMIVPGPSFNPSQLAAAVFMLSWLIFKPIVLLTVPATPCLSSSIRILNTHTNIF